MEITGCRRHLKPFVPICISWPIEQEQFSLAVDGAAHRQNTRVLLMLTSHRTHLWGILDQDTAAKLGLAGQARPVEIQTSCRP